MTLERQAGIDKRSWPLAHLAGLVCCALGAISLIWAAVLIMQKDSLFAHVPAPYVTIPLLVAAVIAAAVSAVRREGAYGLPVAGVAMAAAALALGWVLVLLAVMAATLLVIYILSETM